MVRAIVLSGLLLTIALLAYGCGKESIDVGEVRSEIGGIVGAMSVWGNLLPTYAADEIDEECKEVNSIVVELRSAGDSDEERLLKDAARNLEAACGSFRDALGSFPMDADERAGQQYSRVSNELDEDASIAEFRQWQVGFTLAYDEVQRLTNLWREYSSGARSSARTACERLQSLSVLEYGYGSSCSQFDR